MKFKIGDAVKIKSNLLYGHSGVVIAVAPPFIGHINYSVRLDYAGVIVTLYEDWLESVATVTTAAGVALPGAYFCTSNTLANQSLDDLSICIDEFMSSSMPEIAVSKPMCDCGGFKTFNSMSPENHSSWCSSRKD